MEKPVLIALSGPTACGKTRFGVLLAQKFNGEVVSCDSMQIYRGMTIGTAAPTEEEMEGIPHHMVAVAEPGEQYSVARFVEEADACIQDILSRGKLPILVGGTGLYMDALIRGNRFAAGDFSGEIRKKLYERLEREGIEPLYAELKQVDSDTAERLHLNDEKRILRALEVWLETGKTMTEHNLETQEIEDRYRAVRIALAFEDREDMKKLIDLRVGKMEEAGLLQEVETLMAAGLPRSSTAWQAIGYKEFLRVYDGEATVAEALDEIRLRSRQYAKRQLTWLRKKEPHWILWGKERDFAKALQKATEILTAEGVV